MNRYPAWKNILVVAVIVFGTLLALPNIYGEDPALQVAPAKREPMGELGLNRARGFLVAAGGEVVAAHRVEDRGGGRFPYHDLKLPAAAIRAVQSTPRLPSVHGAPVHLGLPHLIGIADLEQPFAGSRPAMQDNEIPVFWACGVTPQIAVEQARPPLCITHTPGCMVITDLLNSDLAVP